MARFKFDDEDYTCLPTESYTEMVYLLAVAETKIEVYERKISELEQLNTKGQDDV